MPSNAIADVRRFNRTVGRHIGALDERFLGRSLPMGEARLLWEIGPDGCELRDLRARLGLDSGYLSRLARSLEAAGLASTAPSAADRRSRRITLTAAGKRERAVLDRRSDDIARSVLEPLGHRQREELVTAMNRVERLLTAAAVAIEVVDPQHPDARRCVAAYYDELEQRSGTGLDRAATLGVDPDEVRSPAGLVLVAYLHGTAVGCGSLKNHPGAPSEIKRLWVAGEARGLGLGRRLMEELETRAAGYGASAVRLDTNRNLTEAIAMYRSSGYAEVEPYNDEPFAHHWFEKKLAPGR
jgi:DNA-binding MarR family transcriptional regulator/GNAT superfamily N-acetyltransferase